MWYISAWKQVYPEKIAYFFADTAKATARFAPNRVCLHFTCIYHECTHFAWPSFLKKEYYLVTLSVHTLWLDQFSFCTFFTLFQSPGLCTHLHCASVHSLVPACPRFCLVLNILIGQKKFVCNVNGCWLVWLVKNLMFFPEKPF